MCGPVSHPSHPYGREREGPRGWVPGVGGGGGDRVT